MNSIPKYIASLIGVAIGIGAGAGSALAQTTASGAYYATPSWDQTLPSAARFIVLSNFDNEAVLDRETGLVWERSPSISRGTFAVLRAHCINLNLGNRFGWRLPTIAELLSLFNPSATAGPALPVDHPFLGLDPVRGAFWSANRVDDRGFGDAHNIALYMPIPPASFFVGAGEIGDTSTASVWCVRGGVLAGPQ